MVNHTEITPVSGLRGRHVIDDASLQRSEYLALLDLADALAANAAARTTQPLLPGRVIACIFEKASSRTRLAIEVAAARHGARAVFLDTSSQLGHKESLEDTVRLLSATCDAIAFRGNRQTDLERISTASDVPVFNMLTDMWHPTQMWADVLTMRSSTGKPLTDIAYAFIGDGRCNVANSQLLTGALLGMDVRIVAPAGLQPEAAVRQRANVLAAVSGARITVSDGLDALEGVDVVSTDVWVSMGEPEEAWAQRVEELRPYRVTADLMRGTGNAGVRFMHCLPAFHDRETVVGAQVAAATGLLDGIEVTDEVFRGPASLVWQQAAARVCTTEALFASAIR
ncbi:MAG: ornithine carbamoyltransferase [Actinomycetales bacterium]|nr:ornithine carbamoyltransferase [Actinomycetales bacterium]